MSRVLTRPMFRLGGSASGITSGLDSAKLNASRKNFSNGGDAYKEGLRNRVTAAKEVLDEFSPQQRGMMPGSVSSFLTNFGLNLLSQSPTGNIFSTAATAAKQPFQQFQGVRAAEVEQQRRLNQAILGDAMETLSEEKQAQHEGKKSYDPGAAAKIADLTEKSYLRQLELTKRQEELEAKEILTEAEEDELETIGATLKGIASTIDRLEDKKTFLEKLDMAGEDAKSRFWDMVDDFEKEGLSFQEALQKAQEIWEPRLKEGGRVGKQLGGEVSFQEDVEVEKPVGNQMQAASVQNLDYATLRARLPQEIGDDIVQLLAQSEEALTEFANIRTQEDVDQFNTEFNVNLVLPQEV